MQILRHIISARREAGLLSSPLYRDLCFFCRPENPADVELLVGVCKLLAAHRDANGEEHPVMSWQVHVIPLLRNLSTVTSAMLCCWAHQFTRDVLLEPDVLQGVLCAVMWNRRSSAARSFSSAQSKWPSCAHKLWYPTAASFRLCSMTSVSSLGQAALRVWQARPSPLLKC